MSTHADIIIETKDGYKSIYLHSDGYPEHALKILQKNFTDREKVEQMIELGDLSRLAESIECPDGHTYITPANGHSVFYGRDRGESDTGPTMNDSSTELQEHGYSYLYTIDDVWIVV